MNSKREKEINELLTRGVGEFVDPEGLFRKKLIESPQSIVIKFGVDPTKPDLHLGHAVVLRKLRKFQEFGCKIVFLIGDITAQIGDPTGKSKVRPELNQKEVEANMETYLNQVGKVLLTDEKVFSWIRNSDWFVSVSDIQVARSVTYTDNNTKQSVEFPANSFFAKAAIYDGTRMQKTHLKREVIHDVTLRTFLSSLRYITFSRLIDRDMFQERIKKGEELYMHEMMYPILQGIDSNLISYIYDSCDLEIGGTDQTFNMLMGRDMMKMAKIFPQSVLSCKLLVGTDGKEKMSKSLGNYISVTDEPGNMYGKIMSIPDTAMFDYFELCTYTPMDRIEEIKTRYESGSENPKDIKMKLAREIVEIYHGRDKAVKAENDFIETFSKGNIPDSLEEIRVSSGAELSSVLIENGLIASKTEYRRLIAEGAVSDMKTKEKITDQFARITEDMIIKIGKKRFIKITVE